MHVAQSKVTKLLSRCLILHVSGRQDYGTNITASNLIIQLW